MSDSHRLEDDNPVQSGAKNITWGLGPDSDHDHPIKTSFRRTPPPQASAQRSPERVRRKANEITGKLTK